MIKFDGLDYFKGKNGEHLVGWTPTPAEAIARQVADAIAADRDGKIRAALIALGWTPPAGGETEI